jgi:hypothetical protein
MRKETVLSFIFACAVVFGALALLDRSFPEAPRQSKNDSLSEAQSPTSQPIPASSLPPAPQASIQTDVVEQGRVRKCLLGGKIMYSDARCPEGASTRKIALHDSAGIVSPRKDILEELTAQRLAREAVPVHAPVQVSQVVQSNKFECDELGKRIEWLDAMARQPQSGQMQDWIRQERVKTRDRQSAVRC